MPSKWKITENMTLTVLSLDLFYNYVRDTFQKHEQYGHCAEYDVATETWTALVRSSPGQPTLTHDLTGLDKEKFSQTCIKPCQHAGI